MVKSVGFPGFLPQDGQYLNEYLLRSAGHAVLGTLCSHAHRIGLDGTSCLLDGLRKNVSFNFFIVVVVCVLVCPASEVIVLSEQQP